MVEYLTRTSPAETERKRWAAVWEQALPWRDVGDVERGRALADLMLLADAVIASRPDGDEVRKARRPDDVAALERWHDVVRKFHPEMG